MRWSVVVALCAGLLLPLVWRPASSVRLVLAQAAEPTAKPETYITQPGDTMVSIALRHGHTLDELEAANPDIGDPAHIPIGQPVRIPAPPIPTIDAGTGPVPESAPQPSATVRPPSPTPRPATPSIEPVSTGTTTTPSDTARPTATATPARTATPTDVVAAPTSVSRATLAIIGPLYPSAGGPVAAGPPATRLSFEGTLAEPGGLGAAARLNYGLLPERPAADCKTVAGWQPLARGETTLDASSGRVRGSIQWPDSVTDVGRYTLCLRAQTSAPGLDLIVPSQNAFQLLARQPPSYALAHMQPGQPDEPCASECALRAGESLRVTGQRWLPPQPLDVLLVREGRTIAQAEAVSDTSGALDALVSVPPGDPLASASVVVRNRVPSADEPALQTRSSETLVWAATEGVDVATLADVAMPLGLLLVGAALLALSIVGLRLLPRRPGSQ